MSGQMRFRVWWVVAFAAAVSALGGFWWGSAARLDPGVAVGAAALLFMVVLVWLALSAEQAGEKHADARSGPSVTGQQAVDGQVTAMPANSWRRRRDGDPLAEDVPRPRQHCSRARS